MGGEIGFGVRYQESDQIREVYMRRWTNDLFWRAMSPDFFNQGNVLKELVDEAKPENEWPESILCEKIEPAEYGVVMVDFPSREVLSWNHYSTFGRTTVSSIHSVFDQEFENVKAMSDHGMWASAELEDFRESGKRKIEVMDPEAIKAWLNGENPAAIFQHSMVTFNLSPTVMKIERNGETHPTRWHPNYKDIRDWCRTHGWQMPIQRNGWVQ